MTPPSFFDRVRPAHPVSVALFLLLHLALKGVFFSTTYYMHLARPVEVATSGVVTPVVLAGFIEVVILLAVVMGWIGGLRPRDVGLTGGKGRAQLLNAVLVTFLLWGVVQAVLSGLAMTGRFELALNPALTHGADRWSAHLLEATLGSAFVEEVMYRGFLVPQLYLLLRRWMPSRTKRALVALVAPQVYFGLNHIPAILQTPMPAWEVAIYIMHVMLVGLLFAALYLRTGNLFVVIAAHALVNFPAPVFVAGPDPALFALASVCVLLLAWPTLHRWLGDVFTMTARLTPSSASTAQP